MQTAIYIGNEKMQMVYGSRKRDLVQIDALAQIDLPEGVVLNGVITNEELFVTTFRQLMTEHPDLKDRSVKLIIGGDQILAKTVTVPRISDQNMINWIKDEFSDAEAKGDMLYDYRIIKEDDSGDLALACAAQKDMVGRYISLFEEMGTQIESIGPGLDSQIKLLSFLEETADSSYLFLTMDGSSMYASIYMDGIFRVSNWNRIFSERGSAGMGDEVGRLVSNLMQFAHTEGYAQDIKRIYLCGCRKEELFIFKDVSNQFSIATDLLRDRQKLIDTGAHKIRLDEYIYSIGTLL